MLRLWLWQIWQGVPKLSRTDQLGWEFGFSVPISGTPIVSKIPILFLIPKILVGKYFLNSNVWRVRKSEFRFQNKEFWYLIRSRYLFLSRYQGSRKKTIAIQDGGKIIFPAKPTSTHSYWKTKLHLLTLNKKQAIRVSRCRFGAKIMFPAKPTSTNSYGKRTYIHSHLRKTSNKSE